MPDAGRRWRGSPVTHDEGMQPTYVVYRYVRGDIFGVSLKEGAKFAILT